MVEFQISPFSSKYILSSDKIIPKAIVAFLYLKRSVMILTFLVMATEAMVLFPELVPSETRNMSRLCPAV